VKLNGAETAAQFSDKLPAITSRVVGKGRTTYCAFLPSLTYYQPAIPPRPVDRGATDDAMIHFLPTELDQRMARLIASPAKALALPIECSQPLVETTVIESKHGVVVPLVNWTRRPVKGLRVKVAIPTPMANVSLAGGRTVKAEEVDDGRVYTLDLDVADALILR
jgi:hypothetical protein